MAQERTGAITFKGNPLTLVGPAIKAGDKAPDFTVLANDLSPVSLNASAGKVRLISVVPSLDTPVCDMQTRRFNGEASSLGANVVVLTISMDLPFAQKRWCGAAGVERVHTLSDHRDASFGQAYGTLIKELRLETRAIFVVDAKGVVRYVEYVPEVTTHPNYEAALGAAKAALAG
jgi:thiol peroxidase